MLNKLSDIIFRDLANNCFSISEYDFFRLTDFIKFQKIEFTLDLLLISFTSCYNYYLDRIKSINETDDKYIYKTKADKIDLFNIKTNKIDKDKNDISKIDNFNIDSFKEETNKLCYKIKFLASLIEDFDLMILKTFSLEIKNMILTLLINDDTSFSQSFFKVYSKIDPLFCLKLLKKNSKKLDDKLKSLLNTLQQEFEQYEHLSFEIESIINSTISDFKYDLPAYNYLDFL